MPRRIISILFVLTAISPGLQAAPPTNILERLSITPSAESNDYVRTKQQFQLHGLVTEQRHPKTWNLSSKAEKDTRAALDMLLSVDLDVTQKMEKLALDPQLLEQ